MPRNTVPKSLVEACIEGVDEAQRKQGYDLHQARVVELGKGVSADVRNYLAHKFTIDLMDDPKIRKLWASILGEEKDDEDFHCPIT